uniref:DUF4939 domain-containing protein n=1 Tax=Gouania willdenowi TaxID=441366 RepID=A0A8C5E9V3_GOUWI
IDGKVMCFDLHKKGASDSPQPATLRTAREPYIPTPQPYSGELGSCGSFLLKCDLVFEQQHQKYASDRSRIAYVIGLLSGEAAEWATAIWNSESEILQSYQQFITEMKL